MILCSCIERLDSCREKEYKANMPWFKDTVL